MAGLSADQERDVKRAYIPRAMILLGFSVGGLRAPLIVPRRKQ